MNLGRVAVGAYLLTGATPAREAVFVPAALQPVPQLGPDLATNPQRLPPPQRGARRADWLLCALLRGGRADPADALQTLYPCCAGRAVHPQNVGGVRRSVGVEVHHEVRTFLTRRRVLADGLAEQGVPPGAREATGGSCKVVGNLVAGRAAAASVP